MSPGTRSATGTLGYTVGPFSQSACRGAAASTPRPRARALPIERCSSVCDREKRASSTAPSSAASDRGRRKRGDHHQKVDVEPVILPKFRQCGRAPGRNTAGQEGHSQGGPGQDIAAKVEQRRQAWPNQGRSSTGPSGIGLASSSSSWSHGVLIAAPVSAHSCRAGGKGQAATGSQTAFRLTQRPPRSKQPHGFCDPDHRSRRHCRKLARAGPASPRPGVQTAAVVKADAYGLGAARVARALARAGHGGSLSPPPKGAAVRQALGPGPQIAVLSGHMAGDTEMIRDLDLTPMLNSLEQITRHLESLPGHPFGVQLDTGMNRLGVEPAGMAGGRADPAGCRAGTVDEPPCLRRRARPSDERNAACRLSTR
jgi:hypothetical protein